MTRRRRNVRLKLNKDALQKPVSGKEKGEKSLVQEIMIPRVHDDDVHHLELSTLETNSFPYQRILCHTVEIFKMRALLSHYNLETTLYPAHNTILVVRFL